MRFGERRTRSARGWLIAGLCAAVVLGGQVQAVSAAKRSRGELGATISRTAYGVPHIRAGNIESLAFGFAYAFAEDNLCTIADSYVTVSGERSRYFGPDEEWTFSGNGSVVNNLDSDFFYTRINESGVIEKLIRTAPPNGPMPAVKRGVRGYVAGYNHYLRETGVDNLPDPRCRGEEWVRPIEEIDVYRRFYQLGGLASSGIAIPGIASAAPAAGGASDSAAQEAQAGAIANLEAGNWQSPFPLELGSNAYGLGAEATRTGSGMLLGNPHFPWDGAERLYQAHLTIPGKVDVAGGALYGVPLINIGHTDNLAWSHTVATAWRFTPFELTLASGDPYSYVVDGETVPMEKDELTVQALGEDGKLSERSRTLYSTRYGPMITSLLGLPLFPWTAERGYALGDVNATNFRYLNHFYRTNRAQSVREYDRIGRTIQGIPWVNSIAADSRGNAYYSMDGSVPNVSDAKARECAGELGLATFDAIGLPTLDGSRSECGWDEDPAAAYPGLMPASQLPRLFRRDYVTNGNDSHWIANPEQPLTGYPPDRRHRGRRGDPAHAARPDPGPGADRGHRRAARQAASHCASSPRWRWATASTRASCGATSSSASVAPPRCWPEKRVRWRPLRRHATRSRRGTCTTTSARTARSSSAVSRPTCSVRFPALPTGTQGSQRVRQRADLHDAVRPAMTRSTPRVG